MWIQRKIRKKIWVSVKVGNKFTSLDFPKMPEAFPCRFSDITERSWGDKVVSSKQLTLTDRRAPPSWHTEMAALRWHIPFFLEQSRSTHFWDIKSSKWLWGLKAKNICLIQPLNRNKEELEVPFAVVDLFCLETSIFEYLQNGWCGRHLLHTLTCIECIFSKVRLVLHTHHGQFLGPDMIAHPHPALLAFQSLYCHWRGFLLTPHTVHTAASLTELVWRSNHHWL